MINLNNMVSEIDFFTLFSGSVLDVENADEVGRPAAHHAVKQLKQNA